MYARRSRYLRHPIGRLVVTVFAILRPRLTILNRLDMHGVLAPELVRFMLDVENHCVVDLSRDLRWYDPEFS